MTLHLPHDPWMSQRYHRMSQKHPKGLRWSSSIKLFLTEPQSCQWTQRRPADVCQIIWNFEWHLKVCQRFFLSNLAKIKTQILKIKRHQKKKTIYIMPKIQVKKLKTKTNKQNTKLWIIIWIRTKGHSVTHKGFSDPRTAGDCTVYFTCMKRRVKSLANRSGGV